jgi:hypothetical protein
MDTSSSDTPPSGASLRRQALYWAPVGVALIVFGQVALEGLRPALGESRRLAAAEERMLGRYQANLSQESELGRWLRAQNDPIYLERERRMLLAPKPPQRDP